jgi:RNA polymerase-interacting CarD/CdnL/TRCF family regulator
MGIMKDVKVLYSIGDDIVHVHYGIGEIVDIEEKILNGKTTTYYVVKTKDSTFWIPVEEADNERTRPIVPPETIEDNVIEALEADPQVMASHYKKRQKRIKEVNTSGEIVATAKLVRDLAYRQVTDRLTVTESRSFDRLKDRLITEWTRSVGITRRKVSCRIQKILQRQREENIGYPG